MKSSRGFTVIELLIVIVVLAGASVLFFVQKNHVEVAARDDKRKTAINALYYGLEEVYFKQNATYPRVLTETQLPTLDAAIFKDPAGIKIGESSSDYRYESFDCTDDRCKGYILRSSLENEDDYIKKNRS